MNLIERHTKPVQGLTKTSSQKRRLFFFFFLITLDVTFEVVQLYHTCFKNRITTDRVLLVNYLQSTGILLIRLSGGFV